MLKLLPYEVFETSRTANSAKITVRVTVSETVKPDEALLFVRSHLLKGDVNNNWVAKNFSGAGIAVHGGPRPVNVGADGKAPAPRDGGYEFDPTKPVVAYEQDFRLTRG